MADFSTGRERMLKEAKTLFFFSSSVFQGDKEVKVLNIRDKVMGSISMGIQVRKS